MSWDPFLIKKLLKSIICGTVNSTHMHCSQLTKSTIAGWKKKKRGKRGEENVDVQTKRSHNIIVPKPTDLSFWSTSIRVF